MTETEYITLANLIRLRTALDVLSHVIPGYGVTEEEAKTLTSQLYAIQERIGETITTEEDPE